MLTVLNMLFDHVGLCAVERFFAPNIWPMCVYCVFSIRPLSQSFKQWLHGPEAEGRCPNCENACSLAGGTLSLASPSERSLQARRNNLPQAIHSSSSDPVQPHSNDALTRLRNESHPQVPSSTDTTSSSSTSSHSSTLDYAETTVSAEDDPHHIHHPFANERISPPWGVASRLISILMFMIFLYKLRS